jgi:hypothetical protein
VEKLFLIERIEAIESGDGGKEQQLEDGGIY